MLGDLGKLIAAKCYKKLPKVQKICQMVTLVPTLACFSFLLFSLTEDIGCCS